MSGMRHTKKLIGGYTPSRHLGRGKYGVCYLAADIQGQEVVLKRFCRRPNKKKLHDLPENYHEAVILSGLDHPAIPKLLGVINSRAGYFFASDPSLPGSLLISTVEVSSTGICGCQTFYMTDTLFPLLISGFHGTKERRG